jgi:TPP-dependent 2-oxoacid decarboxylase
VLIPLFRLGKLNLSGAAFTNNNYSRPLLRQTLGDSKFFVFIIMNSSYQVIVHTCTLLQQTKHASECVYVYVRTKQKFALAVLLLRRLYCVYVVS